MKRKNPDKEISELYYHLYVDCIKYKSEKKTKEINCQQYYEEFEKFAKTTDFLDIRKMTVNPSKLINNFNLLSNFNFKIQVNFKKNEKFR